LNRSYELLLWREPAATHAAPDRCTHWLTGRASLS